MDERDNYEPDEALPFDIGTLLRRVFRRWPMVARVTMGAALVGVAAALLLGARTYRAETVLLFVAEDENWAALGRPPTLHTLSSMVKTQDNLSAVRLRLGIEKPLPILGSQFDVRVHERTTVLSIAAESDSPTMAADMANTLGEVFQEGQKALRRQEATRLSTELRLRLTEVGREIADAQLAMTDFNRQHGLIDLETESQWHLEEMLRVELQAREAESSKKAVMVQLGNLEKTITELEGRVDEERSALGGSDPNEVSARMQQLRQSIDNARTRRGNWAEVKAQETAFKRAESLYKEGLIPEAEYEQARANYQRARAMTSETGRIRGWRQELEGLESFMLSGGAQQTTSMPVLQGMLLRAFELELERVALEERSVHLMDQREQLRAKLDALPELERAYLDLKWALAAGVAEREHLQGQLTMTKRMRESEVSDFAVAAVARPPDLPIKSNRRLIFAGMVALGLFGALGVVLLLELADRSVVSVAEAELKLGQPILGVVPYVEKNGQPSAHSLGDELMERFKVIANTLRYRLGDQGGRVLIVSAGQGEGTSMVTLGLAASLGRFDDQVIVIDGHIRDRGAVDSLLDVGHPVLRAWLQGKAALMAAAHRAHEAIASAAAGFKGRLPGRGGEGDGGKKTPGWLAAHLQRLTGTPLFSLAGVGEGDVASRFQIEGPHGVIAPPSISRLLIADWERGNSAGLAEFLSRRTADPADILWQTSFPGVSCVPRLEAARSPDLIGSARMGELLNYLDERFQYTLVDGPAVLPNVDAALLARHVDAIVLVVGAGQRSVTEIEAALERLKTARVPLLGIILNGVEEAFL